jgi:hypothetical protein
VTKLARSQLARALEQAKVPCIDVWMKRPPEFAFAIDGGTWRRLVLFERSRLRVASSPLGVVKLLGAELERWNRLLPEHQPVLIQAKRIRGDASYLNHSDGVIRVTERAVADATTQPTEVRAGLSHELMHELLLFRGTLWTYRETFTNFVELVLTGEGRRAYFSRLDRGERATVNPVHHEDWPTVRRALHQAARAVLGRPLAAVPDFDSLWGTYRSLSPEEQRAVLRPVLLHAYEGRPFEELDFGLKR